MELTRRGEQVNENKRSTAPPFDFSEMSEENLRALILAAEQEIARRKEVKREIARQNVLAAAQEAGMTPKELLELVIGGTKKRGRGGKRGAIAWQHPDDPTKVYRGGKKPDWLKELEEQKKEAVKVEQEQPSST
jgi:hypothetical protein